jgi:hypothetical protein
MEARTSPQRYAKAKGGRVTDYIDTTSSGSAPEPGEWSYSLHILASQVDNRPVLVCRHMVTREIGNGEMDERGPYDTEEHAKLIAGMLNMQAQVFGE